MIGKVGSSTSIKGTIDYLEGSPERVDWKATQHLASEDQEFVIAQMQSTASMSKTEQPIYHYSISWDEGDQPSPEQMEAVARQSLSDLGLAEHQALIVTHNDHDYPHLHVMACRVHPETGKAWDRWMDYKKLEQSLRQQERQYGWKEVPGHHHRLEGQQKPHFGQSLNRVEAGFVKEGLPPLFERVQRAAEDDFRQANSWEDLHNRLAEKGFTIQRGSRGTGGKVTNGTEFTNLSKIHRDFSMGRLEKRFGPFRSRSELQKGNSLSDMQKHFLKFEKAYRLNKSKKASALKHGLHKSLKGLATAKKVHNTMNSLLAVSTPSNPAFKAVKMMSKVIASQLKQQSMGRGR